MSQAQGCSGVYLHICVFVAIRLGRAQRCPGVEANSGASRAWMVSSTAINLSLKTGTCLRLYKKGELENIRLGIRDGHANIFGDAHRCIFRIYLTYVGYSAILSDNAEVDVDIRIRMPSLLAMPSQDYCFE